MSSRRKNQTNYRLERQSMPTLQNWKNPKHPEDEQMPTNVVLNCGWGRLIFGHTFDSDEKLTEKLLQEKSGQRDIALYIRDPHVIVSKHPQEVFLDPSHTFRLWFNQFRPKYRSQETFLIRRVRSENDIEQIKRIYEAQHMVVPEKEFIWQQRDSRKLFHLIAQEINSDRVLGVLMGIDHRLVFEDPEYGSSLWSLAVDPQSPYPGVGASLVIHLANYFLSRGRSFLDVSVMYDNEQAIALYQKLGFERITVFAIKRKNPINESLFTPSKSFVEYNPYAKIIIDEAKRRGIVVEPVDVKKSYFRLSLGGRSVLCRESLTDLTSAVTLSICEDKQLTNQVLSDAGLKVPEQILASTEQSNFDFLKKHKAVVVKPLKGEQGAGISVEVRRKDVLKKAIKKAREYGEEVLLESYCEGQDLRLVVINYELVAAAVRQAPRVVGDGQHSVIELIKKLSRRRASATGGESQIPIDEETLRCVRSSGYELEDILEPHQELQVRKTANLHTGGTIHDVTEILSTELKEVGERAARVLNIPVLGLDLIVPRPGGYDYVIIEANERPGLANHEPQPTAQKFIDLLFPQTMKQKIILTENES